MARKQVLLALSIAFAVLLAYRLGPYEAYKRGFDSGYTVGYDYATGRDWGEYPADQYTIERGKW